LAHPAHASCYSQIYFFHLKIKYETITTNATIIDQINKFLKNKFDLELVFKKFGRISIKTAIKKIAGIILSNPIA
tara:strand:- start:164 stop:388 length:225 start_codon:yes stop_codon:yes gene_type:complete